MAVGKFCLRPDDAITQTKRAKNGFWLE